MGIGMWAGIERCFSSCALDIIINKIGGNLPMA